MNIKFSLTQIRDNIEASRLSKQYKMATPGEAIPDNWEVKETPVGTILKAAGKSPYDGTAKLVELTLDDFLTELNKPDKSDRWSFCSGVPTLPGIEWHLVKKDDRDVANQKEISRSRECFQFAQVPRFY